MKLTRRNALIGLGSLVAGSGALVGTGAFSSVEADRTVSINTAGDSGGFLTLAGDGSYVTNNNSAALTIDLGQVGSTNAFNEEARTVVEGVVTVTNNAADGEDITVGFDNGSSPPSASTTLNIGDGTDNAVAKVTLYFGTETSQSTQTISSTNSATMGVIVDTRTGSNGDASDGASADVTLYAEDADGS